MLGLLKKLWELIRSGLLFIGKVNSLILLSIFYYLILGPVAILYRLSKLFKPRDKDRTSYWLPRTQEPETEETLLRQF